MHVCALADALQIKTAVVPVNSGVLSAFGMLAAPKSRELSKSLVGELSSISIALMQENFLEMIKRGTDELLEEGVPHHKTTVNHAVDLRYVGQSYTLRVPWLTKQQAMAEFHQLHEKRFGHQLELPVELVNLRASITADVTKPAMDTLIERKRGSIDKQGLGNEGAGIRVIQRQQLHANDEVVGEALIVETVATTYLAPGWRCKVDSLGNLLLTKA